MRAEKCAGAWPLKLKPGQRRPLLSFQALSMTPASGAPLVASGCNTLPSAGCGLPAASPTLTT